MIIYEVQLKVERRKVENDSVHIDTVYILVAARNGEEAINKCKCFENVPGLEIGEITVIKIDIQ